MHIWSLLLVLTVWPGRALPDTWVPITSEIPGVQLWGLWSADENSFPFEVYEGEDHEFMPHCNNGRPIYISTLETPVKCHFKKAGAFYQIHVETKDKRATESRLVLVSKSPITPRVRSLGIASEEVEILKKAERKSVAAYDKIAKRKFVEMNKKSVQKDYAEYVHSIKSSEKYRKHIGARFKLPSPNGSIYISSIGLDASGYIGWEIVNVVYRKIDGQMQEVGTFAGCIEGEFRDLNSDGTPEVLTSTCENGESSSDSYWAVTPKIKRVLGH
jgi:hypothetical protein